MLEVKLEGDSGRGKSFGNMNTAKHGQPDKLIARY